MKKLFGLLFFVCLALAASAAYADCGCNDGCARPCGCRCDCGCQEHCGCCGCVDCCHPCGNDCARCCGDCDCENGVSIVVLPPPPGALHAPELPPGSPQIPNAADDANPYVKGDHVRVSASSAPLMLGYKVLTTLEAGEEFRVVKVYGYWLGTTVNENDQELVSGWVLANDVSKNN